MKGETGGRAAELRESGDEVAAKTEGTLGRSPGPYRL